MSGTGLAISSALYGVGSQTVDVSHAVISHIQEGKLSLVVSPDALNVQDPAPGQVKTLTVNYTINGGSSNTISEKDGNSLIVNAPPVRVADGLKIVKAEYGYSGNFTDVTNALQDQIHNGSINITVSPKSVGIPDPNPAKQKTLQVQYTINGASSSESIIDGKKFRVSAPVITAPDNKTPSQHAMSFFGIVAKNLAYFFGIYLHALSVFAAMEFGNHFISPMLFGGLAFFIPFFSFWLLPQIVFWVRLFRADNLI